VGRHSVRLSLVILQAMFKQAVAWGWLQANPVKAVPKPSGKRDRGVVCLAPGQVEAIRAALLDRDKLYAATLVSLVAYQGLRVPEEVLGLEVRHVRTNTLLVEQRNVRGEIVAGQKVRGFHPRAVDWVEPARRDLTEHLLALGLRKGPLFPRTDGQAWKLHDYKNWCRRVWHPAVKQAGLATENAESSESGTTKEAGKRSEGTSSGIPPYDLRHAYASLQIRAGLSIPEVAEQMGHSPQMTLATYAHVIRELKGLPRVSAEEQIERAREARGREVDVRVGR
jgi:integrase